MIVKERVWLASMSADELMLWLKAPRAEAPFSILERVDDIDFPAPEEGIALERWSQGRVFGSAFELRWVRQKDVYQVRLVGSVEGQEPFVEWSLPETTENDQDHYYLWGQDETRIGRQLKYRAIAERKGRLCLGRREFRRQADGALILERFTRMEWEENS